MSCALAKEFNGRDLFSLPVETDLLPVGALLACCSRGYAVRATVRDLSKVPRVRTAVAVCRDAGDA